MDKLQFKLDVFEGPLDLLLYLISKNKMNIHNIVISSLLEQYLQYINEIQEANLEIAGEFLEMAAKLVYIKTLSLLPRHEEAEEMKRELTGQLINLNLVKEAAAQLSIFKMNSTLYTKNPDKIDIDYTYRNYHSPIELRDAYYNAVGKSKQKLPPTASDFTEIVEKKIVSVTSKIVYVLKMLYKNDIVDYDCIFKNLAKSDMIAAFLAVLELIKSGRITLSDDNKYLYLNRNLR